MMGLNINFSFVAVINVVRRLIGYVCVNMCNYLNYLNIYTLNLN